MARLILLIVIGFLAWVLFKAVARTLSGKSGDAKSPPEAAPPEDMVTCTRCGVNLPKSEAQMIEGVWRCADGGQCKPRS